LNTSRNRIERGEWSPPAERFAEGRNKALTLADYADRWLEHRNLKARTMTHYRALLDEHISKKLGAIPIKNLTADAIRAWHSDTLVDRPTDRSHAYGLLHAILATAVTDGLIPVNPATSRRRHRVRAKRAPVIPTMEELARVADIINERFRALVLIAAWCGLRWGEVTELRRKDIGEGCETITVSRGVIHRSGQCHVDTPKSGRGRVVVVPPHIRADLKRHLDAFVGRGPEALLFTPTRGGCHLSEKTFRLHYRRAMESVGRMCVRMHDLRHFSSTEAARVGNLAEVIGRLGHSTVTASLRYQQIAQGRDAAVAQALSELAERDSD
jgi:integrase